MTPRGLLSAIWLPTLLVVSGCAVQGPPFRKAEPPPNMAVIYVYRPYSYASSLLHPAVACDGQSIEIYPGGYHPFIVPAGETTCSVVGTESEDRIEIVAAPHSYYVREDFGWGMLSGHPHLNPIDTDTAHSEIDSCVLEP